MASGQQVVQGRWKNTFTVDNIVEGFAMVFEGYVKYHNTDTSNTE